MRKGTDEGWTVPSEVCVCTRVYLLVCRRVRRVRYANKYTCQGYTWMMIVICATWNAVECYALFKRIEGSAVSAWLMIIICATWNAVQCYASIALFKRIKVSRRLGFLV